MRPKSRTIAQVGALVACLLSVPFALAGSKYKVLHDFGSGEDGSIPSGPLTLGATGNLYGNTGAGGRPGCDGYGCGTIFELTQKAGGKWSEKALYNFADNGDGADPVDNLVLDAAGNLYGTLNGAGTGQGAIFELRRGKGTWELSRVYDQEFTPGLLLDKNGNLYGEIGSGDVGSGAIGELSPGSKGWTYTQLYSFCSAGCPDGESLDAPLSWDAQGNLYGTTLFGGNGSPKCPGSLGCGVAFQMTPNSDGTWTYHVMHRFANFPTDGQYPDGGLLVDASGSAYGAAGYGGVHGNGTIFKMTPSSGGRWKQTVLYDFPNCAEGCLPGDPMVFDKAGNLYGVSSGGLADCGGFTCGVVFKLTPQAGGKWKYSVLHKFTGADGGFPRGVIIDGKGNLYGTTQAFGKYNAGVAFEISP